MHCTKVPFDKVSHNKDFVTLFPLDQTRWFTWKKNKECKASRGQKMVDISQLDGLEILYPENKSYKTLSKLLIPSP